MADYENNKSGSFDFDVDKELEALWNNIHKETPQQPTQPPRAQTPQQPTQPPRAQTLQRQSKTARLPFLGQSQPKPKITSTTKNGMKIYEDKTDYAKIDDSNASYYDGEVYFAAKKPVHPPLNAEGTAVAMPKKPYVPKNKFEAFIYNVSCMIRNGGTKGAAIYVAILFAISVIISAVSLSLINDILAFNRSDEVITITVGEDASTNEIISELDKEGLIKHGWFCKLFMGLTKSIHEISGPPVYLSGVYYLTPDMGVEKMLIQCQETYTAETVTVTIPEGFSIHQIAEKLEKSGVCMRDEFYQNLESASYNYKFLDSIDNKEARYNYLEGFMYPDTYEFFVGQNASSVINKLLENFDERWTDKYQKRADEIGMTVDEVVTLASIIQKEAANGEQMPVIAGVFFNRLNSGAFPSLQSDATNVYVNKYIKPNVTTGEYDTYWANYSTYACRGLPVGPICNPGDDAIRAVLWPETVDAYYFCHDKAGNIYTAKTEAEHNANYYSTLT